MNLISFNKRSYRITENRDIILFDKEDQEANLKIMNTLKLLFGRETASSITGDDFLKLTGREELMIIQQGRRGGSKIQLPPIGEKVDNLRYRMIRYFISKTNYIEYILLQILLSCRIIVIEGNR